MWAINDYDKGKIVKLRLVIKNEPEAYESKPTEFEGPYVIREQIGYNGPYLGGNNSPSVQVSKIIVENYNSEMKEMYEHPKEYEEERNKEIEYWKNHILKTDKGQGK